MAKENELDLLGSGDRGFQKISLGKARGDVHPASAHQLREAKRQLAIKREVTGFAKRLESTILGDKEAEPFLPIVDQLATGIRSLHSLALRADRKVIESMSSSVRKAKELTRIPGFEFIAAERMAEGIINALALRLKDGDSPEVCREAISKALLSYRNLAGIDDRILRQLLLATHGGAEISFKGFAIISEQAAGIIIDKAVKQDISPEIIERVVFPTKKLLQEIKPFIEDAEESRLTSEDENPEMALARAESLLKIMSTVADEYILSQGDTEEANTITAKILVETFFAHRIHWIDNEGLVKKLCQQLVEQRHEKTAAEVILQAQQAHLIDLRGTIISQYYDEAGLSLSLIQSHQEAIKKENKLMRFHEDPRTAIPPGTEKVALFLGFFNACHVGHRGLGVGGNLAINGLKLKSEKSIPIVISLNQLDLARKEAINENGTVPIFPFEERKRLALANFAGLSDGFIFTSIDTAIDPKISPKERTKLFLKQAQLKGTRICGFDRKDLTPPEVNPAIIGLRGFDLQNLISQPDKLDEIKVQFPNQEVIFILLQGSSLISSTRTINLAKRWLTEKNEKAYNQLRSSLHNDNVELVIQLVEKELLRGKG